MNPLTLSVDTEKRFFQLEKIIEKGMTHFIEVGTALYIIKNEKLYRDTFRTFEEYYKERWGFGHSYVNYLMKSHVVIENLKTSTTVEVLPKTESQTRPMIGLKPEQQKKVWKKVVETAPEGKMIKYRVMFFGNGNTMVFDEEGLQIPELQQSWFTLFVKFLEEKGINPSELSYVLPTGQEAELFKTSEGNWNWKILSGQVLVKPF